MEYRLAKVGQ
ncbi:hypothetical protein D030_4587A, partial [Vibrio parahaemolyticus AQ3810]